MKNADLWRALDEQVSRHQVTWRWLKGHAGHRENERCDVLATGEAMEIREKCRRASWRSVCASSGNSRLPRPEDRLI